MSNSSSNLYQIDRQILDIDKFICDSIDKFDDSERGFLSQAILAQLRNFAEHIMLKVYANGQDIEDTYENICSALSFVKSRGNLKLLSRFHHFLEIVVSHYTLNEENSERLMLKYYEYLLKIKIFLRANYSLNVLRNLDKFPLNTDANLREYHEKIATRVNQLNQLNVGHTHNDRYYIQKIRPFFVNQKIYYEVTFTTANSTVSKFDRIIAFTDLDISQFYATKLFIVEDSIEILDKRMPIFIIVGWEVSIRPCELENFSSILGASITIRSGHSEYKRLMQYLTETGLNLVEIIDFSNANFQYVKQHIMSNRGSVHFFSVLEKCRELVSSNCAGSNILRYLLYHLKNKTIKGQRDTNNVSLSNLKLSFSCIPFDEMPFCSSLIWHNPRLADLFDCIDSTNHQHELLARYIKNNTEINGQLYTPINEVSSFGNIDALVQKYNNTLYYKHTGRKLVVNNDYIYIQAFESDTLFIIRRLIELAKIGFSNYSNSVVSWLESSNYLIDSPEKKLALEQMFENSKVALVYGSAGTGKSTLINHVSHFFSDRKKLYLANTNPAVDNLKRRVTAANCTFSTIARFLRNTHGTKEYDLLIIDECSTVNNSDMRNILEKASFRLLVLVGDVYQIESIRFGNWFSAARSFISKTSVFELNTPYRSKNKELLELWNRVRHMDETILEHIAKKDYSTTLNESVFNYTKDDEIILCLNYDGLYGINNINRFLQESNPGSAVHWGIQCYKVNDPILFNESDRFAPLIYNNMKGAIVGITAFEKQIQFDIELDIVINEFDAFRL